MSFVGNLLGGGGSGLNFRASGVPPQGLGLQNPTTMPQIQNAYGQVQNALGNQQNSAQWLTNQGSIQNLGNLYNQQQGLANQFQGVANGTGPNPALAQLQNTTGQNIANQGALMAGQRGAGANVGLLARQAANQGANLQQQAVGQGAALGAQQQLAGMQGLQAQQGLMGNQQLSQTGLQLGALNQVAGNTLGAQNNLLGAQGNFNATNANLQGNINSTNAGIQNTTAQGQQALLGGAMNATGLGLGLNFAKGGVVQHFDEGGLTLPTASTPNLGNFSSQLPSAPSSGPQSYAGNFFNSPAAYSGGNQPSQTQNQQTPAAPSTNPGADALYQGMSSLLGVKKLPNGSQSGIAGLLSGAMAKGGLAQKEEKMVPGKANVKGDSYSNDTVPAMLSPGEVVIPRHVMQSEDPAQNAAKFVAAILAKKGQSISGRKSA